MYYKNGEKVISCNTNARNPSKDHYDNNANNSNNSLYLPPGLRLAVVVGQLASQVSIVGYSRINTS